jgi:hypothetical protein
MLETYVSTYATVNKEHFYLPFSHNGARRMKSNTAFCRIPNPTKVGICIVLSVLLAGGLFPAVTASLPSGYPTREALLQDYFNLMSEYPTLMTYQSIGKSFQGTDIPMFEIGNPNGGKVMFTMDTHGDEPQGAIVGYYMAQWILNRTDPAIADSILQNNLIIIIIENIDSYGIKRKNMDLYGYVQGTDANLYGVDLNRNMPVGWGGMDSSSNVTDMHYEGPSPGSEPESQVLINAFQTYKPKFQLNYHYGGGMAFGKPSVYAKMTPATSQYHDTIAKDVKTVAASRGVNVFGYGQLGLGGDVASQAYVSGNSTSYLLEAGNWPAPTLSQIQSILLPDLFPFLIVFAQQSAIAVTTPTTGNHFEDSFKSGSFSAWNGTYVTSGETATVLNTLSYEGNYSAQFTSNGTGGFEGAYCYESMPVSPQLYASGYFYVSQSGITKNDDRFYLIAFTANGSSVAYAGWRRTNGVDLWNLMIMNATGWTSTYSNFSPTLDTWHTVQLYLTEGAANGTAELFVDGELTCSIQNLNTTAVGGVDQVRFGLAEVYGAGPTTVYIDYCRIFEDPPWDTTQDGAVNMHDISIVARAFGSSPGSPNWNPAADVNGDGVVNMNDLSMVARHLGEQYS